MDDIPTDPKTAFLQFVQRVEEGERRVACAEAEYAEVLDALLTMARDMPELAVLPPRRNRAPSFRRRAEEALVLARAQGVAVEITETDGRKFLFLVPTAEEPTAASAASPEEDEDARVIGKIREARERKKSHSR